MWLDEKRLIFSDVKDEYEIGQIPQDDHETKDAYDELVTMCGTDEGIILVKMNDNE